MTIHRKQGRRASTTVYAMFCLLLMSGLVAWQPLLSAITIGGTWTFVAPKTAAHAQGGATTGLNGRIYAIDGSVLEIYDPTTNTWTMGAEAPWGFRFGVAAATGADGRIYAMGGMEIVGANPPGQGIREIRQSSVAAYDPASDTWTTVASMPTARGGGLFGGGHSAVAGADGRIYVMGGRSVEPFDTVDAYDPLTNIWTTVAPWPNPRSGSSAALGSDGRIYVVGGSDSTGLNNAVDAYDPVTDSWTSVAPMPTGRSLLAATTGPDGRVYALGGGVYLPPTYQRVPLNIVEVYDPQTNTWTAGPPMLVPRAEAGATTGADGRIYAIGGYPDGIPERPKSVEALLAYSTLQFFLRGNDVTAGGFTMNATPAFPHAMLLEQSSTLHWFSDMVLTGTFVPGSTFTFARACTLGPNLTTYSIAVTNADGSGAVPLGETTRMSGLCFWPEIIPIPVSTPVALNGQRLRLTLSTTFAVDATIQFGPVTFLETAGFVGVSSN